MGRFGGGVLSYFLVEKLNPYIWLIIFAGCNLFGDLFITFVMIFDADGPLWLVIPSFFIGLGVGGFWVLIAQILIDDAGRPSFGMNWGPTILSAYVGIFIFTILIYLLELGVVVTLLFVVFGIAAVVLSYFAW